MQNTSCCVLLGLFVGFRRHLAFLFTHSPISGRGWFRGTSFRSLFKGACRVEGREGGDEGLKVEGDFTFGRLQGGFKGTSGGLKRGLQEALRGLHLRKAS